MSSKARAPSSSRLCPAAGRRSCRTSSRCWRPATSRSRSRVGDDGSAENPETLTQGRVELVERALAGAELFFTKRIERGCDRVQMPVQVFRFIFHIEQAGDDLLLSGVMLQIGR